jgi:hypothetical protein
VNKWDERNFVTPPVRLRLSLGKQKATSMTVNRSLTAMSTAGILPPIVSASSSGKLEDGRYQSPRHSGCSLFLSQDMVLRILGTTWTIPPTMSPTTATGGGNENVNLRLSGSRPESGDSGVEI